MEEEWLTLEQMAKAADYCKNTLEKRARQGKLPEHLTKWIGRQRFYHRDLIPILQERKSWWVKHQEDAQPTDVVPYDGYLLRPEEIERLELIRRQNGYRVAHYTNLSLTELIAMGGDRPNNYVNC